MLNTVLGHISKKEIGNTRIHEHLLWGWTDKTTYSEELVIKKILPYLKTLKSFGYDTVIEATTEGAGRDVSVLKKLSELSELNIITNCGIWDGLNYRGKYVPKKCLNLNSNDIAEIWIEEFYNGIENTSIKPGIIKIGLGDNGYISDFQYNFLNAAILTSKKTGLPILAHICSSKSAEKIVNIVEEQRLYFNKFIWSHADYNYDSETILRLAKSGIYVEMSWHIGEINNYGWYTELIKKMDELNLIDKLLISQDAGGFHQGNIVPYINLYDIFQNIDKELLYKIFKLNPSELLF